MPPCVADAGSTTGIAWSGLVHSGAVAAAYSRLLPRIENVIRSPLRLRRQPSAMAWRPLLLATNDTFFWPSAALSSICAHQIELAARGGDPMESYDLSMFSSQASPKLPTTATYTLV